MREVDELGLVPEGGYLTIFIPATGNAFAFRVKARVNRGFERIHYGPLPLTAGLPLPSYVGGVIPVPATGVMPGTTYIPSGLALSFPFTGVFSETDMWYIPKDWRERLFHVITEVTPRWLRIDVQIPKGVTQGRFQRDQVSTGVDKLFGYARGRIELVHFPELHYGYRFGNDCSLNVFTGVDFTYAEYIIEVPKNPDLIFDILTKRVASKWITMPISIYNDTIKRAFTETYGIEGFPLYREDQRAEAVNVYSSILREVMV
jgi:hypothetical protein